MTGKTFETFVARLGMVSSGNQKLHEQFEGFLITTVFKYVIYRDTPYEFMEKSDTEYNAKNYSQLLLEIYINLPEGTHYLSSPAEKLHERLKSKS